MAAMDYSPVPTEYAAHPVQMSARSILANGVHAGRWKRADLSPVTIEVNSPLEGIYAAREYR